MQSSLKQKTIHGLFWSFIENFSTLGITFVIGIVLARLLSPQEFGLIGLLTVFTAITQTLADSGFGSALIRKKDCTNTDFSTVFYFNLVVSLLGYAVLFFAAPLISRFYNEPQLVGLARVLGVVVVINALTLVQRAILTRRVDFKLQTKISLIAASVSGVIGVFLAYHGFGVWSLVVRTILHSAMNSVLLWIWNRWVPICVFSKASFHELFSFSYKLLLGSLINTIWINIYDLMIGKFYSTEVLGYYSRARGFEQMPAQCIHMNISRVSYPVLAQLQNDPSQLKRVYKRLIKSTMLITFIILLGMAAVAEPLVITLVGERWRQSVFYLQMLCFAGMLYPLHALNLNMLNVKGRSDLFLKLEIVKKTCTVPILLIGAFYGIEAMLAGMIVNTFCMYGVNSYCSGRLIGYTVREQLLDILPGFCIAVTMAIIVFILGQALTVGHLSRLIIQTAAGATVVFALCERTHLESYTYLKGIALSKLSLILSRS